MKTALFVAALLTLGPASQDRPAPGRPSARERLESLAWLAGSWKGDFAGHEYLALYSGVEGGEILSASKELAEGRLRSFEFERFTVAGEKVLLWPYPAGQGSVSFELVGHDPSRARARFENREHDFPKSLTYERLDGEHLEITLEGDEQGEPLVLRAHLRRI